MLKADYEPAGDQPSAIEEFVVYHELGHLAQAGRTLNGSLTPGGLTDQENIINESFASTVARAIAEATRQDLFARIPVYGYEATHEQFRAPTGGTTGGGTTGGGTTGGGSGGGEGSGGGGGTGDYIP